MAFTLKLLVSSAVFCSFVFAQSVFAENLYVVIVKEHTTSFIDCEIQGHQERCLLDTGSVLPVITAPLDYLKNSPVAGEGNMVGYSGNGSACQQLTLTKSVAAAGRIFSFPVITSCKNYPKDLSPNLGIKIFDDSKVSLDFPDQKLTWNPRQSPRRLENFNRIHNWVIMGATISGDPVEAFFDTGNQMTAVDEKYVAAHPEKFKLTKTINVRTPDGDIREQNLYEIESFVLDGDTFTGLNTVVAIDFTYFHQILPADTVLVLGMNIIEQVSWYFDFQNLKWGFMPPASP